MPLPDAPPRTAAGVRERVVAHALAADIARLHGDALLRTARRFSECADDAHDAYQRSMELLLQHAGTIDRAKAVAWMHVVVRREAATIRRHHGYTVPLETGDVDAALRRTAPVADDQLHAIDLAQRAGEALATLKEAEAQALCLRAQGMSYEEIAEAFGWTYSKVNRAVTEGRRAFVDHYTAVESGVVCGDTAALMSGYVAGTLKPRVAIRVRAHLVRCSGCRALLHAERGADAALRALLPPVFVIAASQRGGRVGGWFHDHLLGPVGHAAGRLQPSADHLLGGKLGVVAASTLALAGGGLAVERQVRQQPAPPPIEAGLTARSATTAPTALRGAPAKSPLVRVVDRAVDRGEVSVARVRQRAAAAARTKRQTARRKAAARARARRSANAREFAGGVSEFDSTTRASASRSAGASSGSSGTASGAASSGTTSSPSSGGTSGAAPPTEVPADAGSGPSGIDVVTEESAPSAPTGGGSGGDFGD